MKSAFYDGAIKSHLLRLLMERSGMGSKLPVKKKGNNSAYKLVGANKSDGCKTTELKELTVNIAGGSDQPAASNCSSSRSRRCRQLPRACVPPNAIPLPLRPLSTLCRVTVAADG